VDIALPFSSDDAEYLPKNGSTKEPTDYWEKKSNKPLGSVEVRLLDNTVQNPNFIP